MTPKQFSEFLKDRRTDYATALENDQPKPTMAPFSSTSSDVPEPAKPERSDEPLHQTAQSERSSLRRPGAPPDREGKRGRLSFASEGSFVNTVTVKSYLSSAEDLWFSMPNAVVYCVS